MIQERKRVEIIRIRRGKKRESSDLLRFDQ